MKRKQGSNWILAIPAAAGLVGLGLRLWLYGELDYQKLLPIAHPAYLMILLTAVVGGGLTAVVTLLPGRLEKLRFPFRAMGSLLAALGILVSLLFGGKASRPEWIVQLLGAAVFVWDGLLRLQKKKLSLLVPALITIFTMAAPFLHYRSWSADPQVQNYLFQVLSSVCLALYAYFCLQEAMGKKQIRLQRLFGGLAILWCLMSIPSGHWGFYVGLALWSCGFALPQAPVMELPKDVMTCIRTLEEAGFQAYAVGGCVRDALLGDKPHDFDLCTDATPEEICNLFADKQLVRSGEKHGTIGVVLRRKVYEITTFRTEGGYEDNRHPGWVQFETSLEKDLARRDFTVNAIAYCPRKGYIDPFGGMQDLEDGVIRCVGEPRERFREDGLRILRGMRFAARLGFRIDPKTEQAMRREAELLDGLARERVLEEMTKFLVAAKAQDILRFEPLITRVIPELSQTVGFLQHNRHHAYDVYTHTAYVVENVPAEPALRWAALLHDGAKPATFTRDDRGEGHFYGHAGVSAELADHTLRQLKASNALREDVVFLVENHMLEMPAEEGVLRRRLNRFGKERVEKLLQLQQADRIATGTGKEGDDPLAQTRSLLEKVLAEAACLSLKDLAIDGGDLLALGYPQGKALGESLQKLLELVLDGTLPNEKQALLEKAKELME